MKSHLKALPSLMSLVVLSLACSTNSPRSQISEEETVEETGSCEQEDFLEGNFDSNVFTLSGSDVNDINADDIEEELAVSLVRAIGMKKGCEPESGSKLVVDHSKTGCALVVPEAEETFTCFVKTNVGDFFVITDALGGANVIFNRFD